MKSKRAEKYLRRIHGELCFMSSYDKERIINPYTCKQAIDRAEQDARDRAIKAFLGFALSTETFQNVNEGVEYYTKLYDNEQ